MPWAGVRANQLPLINFGDYAISRLEVEWLLTRIIRIDAQRIGASPLRPSGFFPWRTQFTTNDPTRMGGRK